MKKIVLFCALGMSTSLLVSKMEKVAVDKGLEYNIEAHPITSLEEASGADIILLGPQVKYTQKNVQAVYPNVPLLVIGMVDYGMMNAGVIIDSVEKELSAKALD